MASTARAEQQQKNKVFRTEPKHDQRSREEKVGGSNARTAYVVRGVASAVANSTNSLLADYHKSPTSTSDDENELTLKNCHNDGCLSV